MTRLFPAVLLLLWNKLSARRVRRPFRAASFSILLMALLLASIAAGCGSGGSGGGNNTSQAGRASFYVTVQWPPRGRQVPALAESVRIDICDARGYTDSRVLDRPPAGGQTDSTALFSGVVMGVGAGIVTITFTEAGTGRTAIS